MAADPVLPLLLLPVLRPALPLLPAGLVLLDQPPPPKPLLLPPRPLVLLPQFLPNQALYRIYGEQTSVDAKGSPAAIDTQTAQRLLADVVRQLGAPGPSLALSTPWRVLGLFASQCFVCRASSVCGAASCAEQVTASGASILLAVPHT